MTDRLLESIRSRMWHLPSALPTLPTELAEWVVGDYIRRWQSGLELDTLSARALAVQDAIWADWEARRRDTTQQDQHQIARELIEDAVSFRFHSHMLTSAQMGDTIRHGVLPDRG